ncbi:MAG: iron-siderophore ABC transporter substrate-binding protein [Actinomycetota bacterium]|nr:iron-siderophore ABC transporter substrate-binding protein [Actinomycetota bacterium]
MTSPVDSTVDNLADRVARGRLGKPLSRRLFLAGTTVGAATLGLAACGGGSTTEAPPITGSADFPVTLKGKEGTATIPAEPQRVVTLGLQRDTDTALALGVTPIAMTENTFVPNGIAPWVESELTDPRPELLNTTDGIPFEKIVGLRPDLILATDSQVLPDNYTRLAQIAPTVSYLDGVSTDTWQQRTTLIGRALGRDEQAQKIITDLEARVAQTAQDNPAFAGKTFSQTVVGGREVYAVLEGDTAVAFLEQLGLRISPEVAALPNADLPEPRALVSLENLGVLEADIMIITYLSDNDRAFLESNQLFQQLDAVKNGNYIPLDFLVSFALAYLSPLTIPYGLDRAVPAMANVLA